MTFSLLAAVVALSMGVAQTPGVTPAPTSSAATPPSAAAAPAAAPVTVDPDALPISLARIQKAVTKPQAIKLTENRNVYRVEVFGDNPTIQDILGPDFLRGPVPYSGMTHQEFLNMVTPKDVQGYAAFSNSQGMVVAATSIALQWAVQKALDKYKDARNDRAKAAATREVQEALDALRRARRDAGLPDK
ncbi:MAG: hypothetical protein ABI211_06795 [Vicinamibacterales bacterium]